MRVLPVSEQRVMHTYGRVRHRTSCRTCYWVCGGYGWAQMDIRNLSYQTTFAVLCYACKFSYVCCIAGQLLQQDSYAEYELLWSYDAYLDR